ncbi:hypothetical protein [Shewanella livingstonensis]|uniref:hypothetical protein n=1 Tax=Shewanella livingstonensis TaxID=150120 RepID=UPI0013E2CA53|nr:hypothetical protein [Shewanella livingstonensis]
MRSTLLQLLTFVVVTITSFNSFAVTNWVDFEVINGHINLPVTINGVETRQWLSG